MSAEIEYKLNLPNILLKGLIEATVELETAKRALSHYRSQKGVTGEQIKVCEHVIDSKQVQQQKLFNRALDLMLAGVKCIELDIKEKDQQIAKLQEVIENIQKQIDQL